MTYQVTKTYSPERGFSCVFRQWKADSHCHFFHGYALGISVTFECDDDKLDHRGWVVDFGGMDSFKNGLTRIFDHTMLVAGDDPALFSINALSKTGAANVVMMPAVGCEAFANMVCRLAAEWLEEAYENSANIRVVSATVFEHAGNSATYKP